MSRPRKTFSNEFKAKVAPEAIKGYKSMNEIAKEYAVHPNAVGNRKKEVMERLPEIFNNKRGPRSEPNTELIDRLYKQIGKQQVELNWLKKSLTLSLEIKRKIIEPENSKIGIQRQCSLIDLCRSSYYYSPIGVSQEELEIMEKIDRIYTAYPFYGIRKITEELKTITITNVYGD